MRAAWPSALDAGTLKASREKSTTLFIFHNSDCSASALLATTPLTTMRADAAATALLATGSIWATPAKLNIPDTDPSLKGTGYSALPPGSAHP